MSGTALELRNRLTRAIDREGNVLDMASVLEVIGLLETTPITAEELQVTRLGKSINTIRKKTSEKSLARRIKQLLKSWQKLASASLQNGIQTKPASPTPFPPSIQGSLSITAMNTDNSSKGSCSPPQVTHDVFTDKQPFQKTVAVSNRANLAFRFSAVKKSSSLVSQPSQPQVPTQPPVLLQPTRSEHENSSPPNLPFIEDITPVNEPPLHLDMKKIQAKENVQTNGVDAVSLTNSALPLIVKLPLSRFVVSVSRHLLSSASADQPVFLPPSSTDNSLSSIEHQKSPISPVQEELVEASPKQMLDLSSTGAPSGRLKCEIPDNCREGMDGCLGRNGIWYNWTDYIPSQEESGVIILPYVYVDGLEPI